MIGTKRRRIGWLQRAALGAGALVAALACAGTHPAGATDFGQMTLADLYQLCRSTDQGDQVACQFYVLGIAEGGNAEKNVVGDKAHFCIPDKLSGALLAADVTKAAGQELNAFPKDAGLPAVNFVFAVLVHEYPCPGAK